MSFLPTLLKYDFATEAPSHPLDRYKDNHEGKDFEDNFHMCKGVNMKAPQYFRKDLELKSIEKENEKNRLQEILNYIFPPRTFFDNGKDWIQFISVNPSNQFDLKGLEGEMQRMLIVRSARKKGLCLIKSQIFRQLADELIRQITIECVDRGLLMVKIRDEYYYLVETFNTLIDSSYGFLARKCIEAKNQYNDRLIKTNKLIDEKKNLEKQVYDLKIRVEQIDKRNQELMKQQESKNVDQLSFYKAQVLMFKSYIDEVISGSKFLT